MIHCTTRYLPERYRCSEKKRYMHPNVHNSNVHHSQTVEGAETSFNRWMDKENVVHIYTGILLSHQKERLPNICSSMDGTGGDYAKWKQSLDSFPDMSLGSRCSSSFRWENTVPGDQCLDLDQSYTFCVTINNLYSFCSICFLSCKMNGQSRYYGFF